MALIYLGTDFHNVPLSYLEKFETSAHTIHKSLSLDQKLIYGAVVLSTCNRFEIYFEADTFHDSVDYVTEVIAKNLETSTDSVTSTLKVLYGDSVPQHLFSVAAGLESMVVGEEEISGQVKRALLTAHEINFASKNLNKLFQNAASVAKSVATETGLGASGRSIITTALEIAVEKIGDLKNSRVLLIGTGSYSRVVTAALERLNVSEIFVYSRTGRAEEFSTNHNTTPVTKEQLVEVMASADLVVSSSGTKGYVIDRVLAEKVAELRIKKTNLVLIDVSLSKDVDPEVSCTLGYDVIDLELVKEKAPQEHLNSIVKARDIIHSAVLDFEETLLARSTDPVVTAMRSYIESRVVEEIENVRRKSGDELASEVEKSLRKVVNGLFHEPSVRARELAVKGNQKDYVEAVKLLFDIKVDNREKI
jgi:glutamyl-tRNA reductase